MLLNASNRFECYLPRQSPPPPHPPPPPKHSPPPPRPPPPPPKASFVTDTQQYGQQAPLATAGGPAAAGDAGVPSKSSAPMRKIGLLLGGALVCAALGLALLGFSQVSSRELP